MESIHIINDKANTKEVFDNVRKLNGKPKSTIIRTLTDENGNQVHEQTVIANIIKNNLEQTYKDNSNTNNQHRILQDNDRCSYNDIITLVELEQALASCKGSSPGPDELHYEMIKELNIKGKKTLLELFNKIYDTGQVPKTFSCHSHQKTW
jgi:hypothetical protein